jgi:hypothetical protein
MKVSIKLFLFASLCFFTSCYKQKACFTSNIYSGDIKKVLGNCRNDVGGSYAEIDIDDAYVYLSDSAYKKAVDEGGMCYFSNIDFNLHSLVGCEVDYFDSAYFNREIEIDHTNKIIKYHITITSSKRRFQLRRRVFFESNMVLIPRVTKDYILETQISESVCD